MSILGSIFSKVFGHHADAPEASSAPAAPQPTPAAPEPTPASTTSAPEQTADAAPASPPPVSEPVDVAAMLDGLAAKSGQTFDWRHSIVDMMKLLGLDSSLSSRQALAKELQYTGDTHDSATMNVWLHKQVMAKLAANGGKVPDDLK